MRSIRDYAHTNLLLAQPREAAISANGGSQRVNPLRLSAPSRRRLAASRGKAPLSALAAAQRPRERLLREGPRALQDEELMALVLRTGSGEKDAVALARELMERFGDVGGVLAQHSAALLAVNGLGSAKVAALVAIPELLKRAELARLDEEESAEDDEDGSNDGGKGKRRNRKKRVLSSSKKVRRYVSLHLAGNEREVFGAVFLTSRHRPLAVEDIFFGSVDRASVHPREVVRRCLRYNAAAVILYHNHPSGVPQPSETDKEITERLKAVLSEIDVVVVDHVVVGSLRPVSMAELGLL